MKKGLAIILLVVFLFNVGGYYIVFWGIHFQLDQKLTSRLDANLYDEQATIELKIPMTLPYPIHSNGFERVNGRFEHQGEFYKLVKHKLQNDTLYVVCIRDVDTRSLVSTMINYVQGTLGLTNTTKNALNFLSKLIKDYYHQEDTVPFRRSVFLMALTVAENPDCFKQPVLLVHAPPPRF